MLCLDSLMQQVMLTKPTVGWGKVHMIDLLLSAHGAAVIGGGLVGLSAALLLVLTGRDMNLSEMLGSLLGGNEGLAATSIAFLAGLVLAPTIWQFWAALPAAGGTGNVPLLLAAGLLAGFGTRLGGTGITGQAILGLAQVSKRSLVALVCIVVGGMLGVAASSSARAVLAAT
jgi:uncharacterized membrane protein YedE/YeeE